MVEQPGSFRAILCHITACEVSFKIWSAGGELKRISHQVKAKREITEIAGRVMKSGEPVLLFVQYLIFHLNPAS